MFPKFLELFFTPKSTPPKLRNSKMSLKVFFLGHPVDCCRWCYFWEQSYSIRVDDRLRHLIKSYLCVFLGCGDKRMCSCVCSRYKICILHLSRPQTHNMMIIRLSFIHQSAFHIILSGLFPIYHCTVKSSLLACFKIQYLSFPFDTSRPRHKVCLNPQVWWMCASVGVGIVTYWWNVRTFLASINVTSWLISPHSPGSVFDQEHGH